MKRNELQELAIERLNEAQALLGVGLWSGAYYLSGYSIELALKACIARQFQAEEIPDLKTVQRIWTHKLDELLTMAKLKPDLDKRCKVEAGFASNWNSVMEWNEAARYRKIDENEAREMLEALSNPNDGVFEWIRSKW
jgi:HEPN domain-containing protein